MKNGGNGDGNSGSVVLESGPKNSNDVTTRGARVRKLGGEVPDKNYVVSLLRKTLYSV